MIALLLFSFVVSAKPCGSLKRLEVSSAQADFVSKDGTVQKNETVSRGLVGDYAWDVLGSEAMIRNRMTGKKCPAIFDFGSASEETYAMSPGDRVLVHLTGAGDQSVAYFDLETCTKLWEARSVGIDIEARKVKLQPNCGGCDTADSYDTVCSCTNAEVYVVNTKCDLELSRPASKAYTKQVLGVAFLGRKDIKDAKSPKAKFAK